MRLPRVRFTVRQMMVAVMVAALLLPPAIYVFCIWQNLKAYGEWASGPKSGPYQIPYSAAGSWPWPYTPTKP
jgi:hypothetical protein